MVPEAVPLLVLASKSEVKTINEAEIKVSPEQ